MVIFFSTFVGSGRSFTIVTSIRFLLSSSTGASPLTQLTPPSSSIVAYPILAVRLSGVLPSTPDTASPTPHALPLRHAASMPMSIPSFQSYLPAHYRAAALCRVSVRDVGVLAHRHPAGRFLAADGYGVQALSAHVSFLPAQLLFWRRFVVHTHPFLLRFVACR
mmetsp:Transcript_64083/g.143232  ORF Transcript_64083/g.143232 Transcript_64083/m.143232 type:complete len:164 (-) Transcript_64083:822-1313(-)